MRENERWLEDWICEHPEALCEGMRIIERQVHLVHGIADLLGWSESEFYGMTLHQAWVIELKARPLKDQDLAQVLRYTRDVQDALQSLAVRHDRESHRDMTLRGYLADQALFQMAFGPESYGIIAPTLVGRSIHEELLAACEAAGVTVKTWAVNDGVMRFTSHLRANRSQSDTAGSEPWALALYHRIREASMYAAERRFETVVERLFTGKQSGSA